MARSRVFNIRKLMTWLTFTKLFFVISLALSSDDKVPQLLICAILTTASSYLLALAIKRTIDEEDSLPYGIGAIDFYIMLYLDLGYTWTSMTGQSAVA